MFREKGKSVEKRGRGRPPGRTEQGEQTRERLYATATRLFAARGFDATTLREIAAEAGVSPGLLYRYFPSKQAVVLELYARLTGAFVARAGEVPAGGWYPRFLFTLGASLDTLRDHRDPLRATLLLMLSDPETGLFSPAAAATRGAVRDRFVAAVTGASNAPAPGVAEALGRLLDFGQLGVILWWLLDRSPGQRATDGLVGWIGGLSAAAGAVLWVPGASAAIMRLDALLADAFTVEEGHAHP